MTRFEKAAEALDDLVGQFEQVDIGQLTKLQRARANRALVQLRERVARLEARLRG